MNIRRVRGQYTRGQLLAQSSNVRPFSKAKMSPHPVILVEASRTAKGGTTPHPPSFSAPQLSQPSAETGGSGIQRNEVNRLGHVHNKMVRRSRSLAGLPQESSPDHSRGAWAYRGVFLLLLAAYGAPRRHSRACSGIQRNKANHLGITLNMNNKMICRSGSKPEQAEPNTPIALVTEVM